MGASDDEDLPGIEQPATSALQFFNDDNDLSSFIFDDTDINTSKSPSHKHQQLPDLPDQPIQSESSTHKSTSILPKLPSTSTKRSKRSVSSKTSSRSSRKGNPSRFAQAKINFDKKKAAHLKIRDECLVRISAANNQMAQLRRTIEEENVKIAASKDALHLSTECCAWQKALKEASTSNLKKLDDRMSDTKFSSKFGCHYCNLYTEDDEPLCVVVVDSKSHVAHLSCAPSNASSCPLPDFMRP